MDEITPTLASRVAESINLREGMTRNKLSEKSGIPYSTLTRKLNGHADFTMRELGSIARALNLTLGELIPTEILDAA